MKILFVTLLGAEEDHNHVRHDARLQSRWKVRGDVVSVEANMPLAGDDNARVRRVVQEMGKAIGLAPKEERRGILTWSGQDIDRRLKPVLDATPGSQERFAAVEALPNAPAPRRSAAKAQRGSHKSDQAR